MSEYLILTDDNDNAYNFPSDFWISGDSWETNSNIKNSYYAPGGRNIADGFLKARVISLTGQIRADSLSSYEVIKRSFVQAILKGGRLSKSNDAQGRYITVRLPSANSGQELFQQYQEFTIDFIAEFPFWVESSLTTETNIVAGNDSFTIDNTGSDFVLNPLIQIEADQSADVPGVKLTNKSDGGISFNYDNPFFVQGDIVTIDSDTGNIKRNGGFAPEYFDGAYLRLQPGNNTVEYEGNAATIKFIFRRIFL